MTRIYVGSSVKGQHESRWMLGALSSGAVLVAAGLIILWVLRRPVLGGLVLGVGLLAQAVFLGVRASVVRRNADSSTLLASLYLLAMGLGVVLGLVTLAISAIVLVTGQPSTTVLQIVRVLPVGGVAFIIILIAAVLIDPYELTGD